MDAGKSIEKVLGLLSDLATIAAYLGMGKTYS